MVVVAVVVVAFALLVRIVGECPTTFIPCLHFFILRWRLAHAHLFHSLGQDRSTVAQ